MARALEPVTELEQVGAVRLERVAGQPALELEVGEEVEHEVLIRLDAVCDGHGEVFAAARGSACRCNGAVQSRRRSSSSPISVFESRTSSMIASSSASGRTSMSMRSCSSVSADASDSPVAR